MSFNKVIFMGNLTRDPETRQAGSSSVCAFGLASSRKYKTKDGEQREETTFVDVEAWGRTGELVQQYMAKGRKVLVEGELKLDTWDDKDTGAKRSKLSIRATTVTFVGGQQDGGQQIGRPEPAQNSEPSYDDAGEPAL